jgi:hypothetical protein
VITDVPAEIPVTNPPAEIVAMPGDAELQVPPPDASVNKVVWPTHTVSVPLMGAGNGLTVTVRVAEQPDSNV